MNEKNLPEEPLSSLAKQITNEEIDGIIKNYPGSFALYRLIASNQIENIYYSPDRPSFSGYEKDEYERLSSEPWGLIFKDDRMNCMRAIQKTVKTGQDAVINYRIKHKVFGYVWLHAIYRLIGWQNNKPVLCVSFMDNTSEGKSLSQLLDSIKTIVYVVDAKNYKLLYANKAALLYGHKSGEYAGQTCYSFIRGESNACADCFFKNLDQNGQSRNEVYRKNSHIWHSVFCQRIDWCGRDAIIQTVEDITDYKRLQSNLINQKTDLEKTISSIPVGIAVYEKKDDQIKRISLNADVTAIKGVSQSSLMKDSFLDIFKRVWPPDRDRVIQDTRDVFIKGHTICIYQTRNEKTGRYMYIRREGQSIDKPDGTKMAYFCYIDISTQMEAEMALRQSQERYQFAVKGGNIAVWEYDLATKVIFSPEKSLSQINLPNRIENVPDGILPFFLPSSYQGVIDQISALNRGEEAPVEDLWIKGDGSSPRCYKFTYSLTRDERGKPSKAYGVAQDITFQKKIEEEYSRLSMEFFSFNPGALCSFRLNLNTNRCNEGHGSSSDIQKKLASKSADEFFQKLLSLIDDEKDLTKAKLLLNRESLKDKFYAGQKNISLTYRRKTEDNEDRFVTTNISLIQNPHTQDIEALLCSVDSNESVVEKLIDERLSNDNYEFSMLINAKTGKILYYNKITDDGSVPRSTDDFDKEITLASEAFLSKEEAEKMRSSINIASIVEELDKASSYSYSFSFAKGPYANRVKLLSFAYLDDSHREIVLARSDISQAVEEEKKQAEILKKALDEAQKANQLKTDFFSNVSHDMRTPLNGVIGYTDLALESQDLKTVKDYLQKIKKSGELLMSLINDTLDLSRIETGHISIQKTPVSLLELFQKITTVFLPSVNGKNISFAADITQAVDKQVSIDVLKVTEIINNLLSNALKFTSQNGHISLIFQILKEDETQYLTQISVKDDGVGMSKEFLAKAFEPFSQEKTTQTAQINGFGLGLSIVKQLSKLMGGEIQISSEPGQGTQVNVTLPMEKAQFIPKAQEDKEEDFSCLKGKKILLCEDNSMNAEIATYILTKYGMETETASNGQEGLEKFLASPLSSFAAILMDIRMPVMDGFTASKAIRNLDREDAKTVPIIAMTADAYADDIKRCLNVGMNAHISKPINRLNLLKDLKALIRK